MHEACVVGPADDDAAADAEDEADDARDMDEIELDDEGIDDDVDTRMLELVTDAVDEVAEEDRETELVTFVLLEMVAMALALAELERDKETEGLIEADREAEDEVEVDAGTDEEGATIVPFTFLGIAKAPPSPVDRYKATLFH
jgi:hypothetical protein